MIRSSYHGESGHLVTNKKKFYKDNSNEHMFIDINAKKSIKRDQTC